MDHIANIYGLATLDERTSGELESSGGWAPVAIPSLSVLNLHVSIYTYKCWSVLIEAIAS